MKFTTNWRGVMMAGLLMGAHAAMAAPALTDAGKAELSKYTAGAVSRGMVPGVVTLVLNRDGVLYENAAGKQDVARNVDMSIDTLFRIASMTKPVTAVAALLLVDIGQQRAQRDPGHSADHHQRFIARVGKDQRDDDLSGCTCQRTSSPAARIPSASS